MRISDWSSDVCSSDLVAAQLVRQLGGDRLDREGARDVRHRAVPADPRVRIGAALLGADVRDIIRHILQAHADLDGMLHAFVRREGGEEGGGRAAVAPRSEEHTSELQSLMRISYAVFCLKNKS